MRGQGEEIAFLIVDFYTLGYLFFLYDAYIELGSHYRITSGARVKKCQSKEKVILPLRHSTSRMRGWGGGGVVHSAASSGIIGNFPGSGSIYISLENKIVIKTTTEIPPLPTNNSTFCKIKRRWMQDISNRKFMQFYLVQSK